MLHEAVNKSQQSNTLLGVALLLFALAVTVLYIYTENAIHHQIATAIIVSTFAGSVYILFDSLTLLSLQAFWGVGVVLRSTWSLRNKHIKLLIPLGLITMIGAFALWNIDNIFCADVALRVLRCVFPNDS